MTFLSNYSVPDAGRSPLPETANCGWSHCCCPHSASFVVDTMVVQEQCRMSPQCRTSLKDQTARDFTWAGVATVALFPPHFAFLELEDGSVYACICVDGVTGFEW